MKIKLKSHVTNTENTIKITCDKYKNTIKITWTNTKTQLKSRDE